MTRMGYVQRRQLIDKTRRSAEAKTAKVITPLLARQYSWLKRDLRRQNLRKRIRRGDLTKQDPWQEWIDDFATQIKQSLSEGASDISEIEIGFFESRGFPPPAGWDAMASVDAYQARIGRLIRRIGEDTLSDVQKDIGEWYKTDQGLPELIDTLGRYFDPTRAELIAETEMGFVTSQVSLDMMEHFGLSQWFWDAILDRVTCEECQDLHGKLFNVGDEAPPHHPACRCGMLFAQDGQVLKSIDPLKVITF